MQLSRRTRLIAALIALISMLFTQLAVAAYTCRGEQAEQVVEATAYAGSHHDMEGCSKGEQGRSALCHAHCQPPSQSLDRSATPDIPPFVAIALVSAMVDTVPVSPSFPPRGDGLLMQRVTSPPLSIRHCCFRI